MNLKTKPEWYLSLYAAGKVPALERDGAFVPESVVTCELLEELYPEPALHPALPWQRAADRALLETFNSVSRGERRCMASVHSPSHSLTRD